MDTMESRIDTLEAVLGTETIWSRAFTLLTNTNVSKSASFVAREKVSKYYETILCLGNAISPGRLLIHVNGANWVFRQLNWLLPCLQRSKPQLTTVCNLLKAVSRSYQYLVTCLTQDQHGLGFRVLHIMLTTMSTPCMSDLVVLTLELVVRIYMRYYAWRIRRTSSYRTSRPQPANDGSTRVLAQLTLLNDWWNTMAVCMFLTEKILLMLSSI
nr:hypothetical protein 2 [Wenzhou sobemo-like virus 3]